MHFKLITSVTIEENSGLLSIGANAFGGNPSSLTHINFPTSHSLAIAGWRDNNEKEFTQGDSFNNFASRYYVYGLPQ